MVGPARHAGDKLPILQPSFILSLHLLSAHPMLGLGINSWQVEIRVRALGFLCQKFGLLC